MSDGPRRRHHRTRNLPNVKAALCFMEIGQGVRKWQPWTCSQSVRPSGPSVHVATRFLLPPPARSAAILSTASSAKAAACWPSCSPPELRVDGRLARSSPAFMPFDAPTAHAHRARRQWIETLDWQAWHARMRLAMGVSVRIRGQTIPVRRQCAWGRLWSLYGNVQRRIRYYRLRELVHM